VALSFAFVVLAPDIQPQDVACACVALGRQAMSSAANIPAAFRVLLAAIWQLAARFSVRVKDLQTLFCNMDSCAIPQLLLRAAEGAHAGQFTDAVRIQCLKATAKPRQRKHFTDAARNSISERDWVRQMNQENVFCMIRHEEAAEC
jgi:hypothetical protein